MITAGASRFPSTSGEMEMYMEPNYVYNSQPSDDRTRFETIHDF